MKRIAFWSLTACFISIAVAVPSTPPFLPNIPGQQWEKVGYMDMSDPAQQCPDSWEKIASPRVSCGKTTGTSCESVNISTTGGSYQQVCGRFRGYQVGSPDAFGYKVQLGLINVSIESSYVDGISITYGSPGNRHHVYTYAAGLYERNDPSSCPCAGGVTPPEFVGSDYYCESGSTDQNWNSLFYYSDVLWDGQQCGGIEDTCCSPPNLPWFCKTFPTPISEDLEVRICTDESLLNENVALEFFELYILRKLNWYTNRRDLCVNIVSA